MNNAEYSFGGYLTGTPEPMEDPRFPSFNFSVPVPAPAPMPTRDMAPMSPFNSSNVPSTGLSFQQQEMIFRITNQATAAQLQRTGNAAYAAIYTKYLEATAELKAMQKIFHSVPQSPSVSSPSGSFPSGSVPSGSKSSTAMSQGLPHVDYELKLQDQASFPGISYFTKSDWIVAFKFSKDTGKPLKPLGYLQYPEYKVQEDGSCGKGIFVSSSEQSVIYDYSKLLWAELYWYGADPSTWDSSLEHIRDWFCAKLTLRFPLFGACNDSRWKAHSWAIKRFPDWNRDVRDKGILRRNPNLGNVVGGIKREHEDDSFQAPTKKRTRVIKHEIVDVDMFESDLIIENSTPAILSRRPSPRLTSTSTSVTRRSSARPSPRSISTPTPVDTTLVSINVTPVSSVCANATAASINTAVPANTTRALIGTSLSASPVSAVAASAHTVPAHSVSAAHGIPAHGVSVHNASALSPDAPNTDANANADADAVSPDAISPDAVSPDAVSLDTVSPDAVSPDTSPDTVSPDANSDADVMSPDVHTDVVSPDIVSPDADIDADTDAISPDTDNANADNANADDNISASSSADPMPVPGSGNAASASGCPTSTTSVLLPRIKVNPLMSFEVPPSNVQVPPVIPNEAYKASSKSRTKAKPKPKAPKLQVAIEGSITPRNLFCIDHLVDNAPTTEEFKNIWDTLDEAVRDVYNQRSKVLNKERRKAAK